MGTESLEKRYYKIREVSEMLDVSIPTLRFWEGQFPQLHPRRNEGRTRFYTPTDIETIRMVKYLLKDRGLKIEAAREQMKTNSSAVIKRRQAVIRLQGIRAVLKDMLEVLDSRENRRRNIN